MIKQAAQKFLPLIVLGAGVFIGGWFLMNPDEAKKREGPPPQALLVETAQAEYGSWPAVISVMGQVVPSLSIALKAQVAGEIIAVTDEFIPGGFYRKGETILDIDPVDYTLAVKKQEALLQQAQADYDLEMGRQAVARDELKILERTTGRKPENPDLALRAPQRAQAQAKLEQLKSDLETAKLALSRTRVLAPFNALVTERAATRGDKVSAGSTLATLVNTDVYWIELSVPVDDLRWLEIPVSSAQKGSKAVLKLDNQRGQREGFLLKLTGVLDPQSRLATILVAVADPLLLSQDESVETDKKPRLLLDDYVEVSLQGRMLENVLRLPRAWLRDGNIIWVKQDGKLHYKSANVVFEDHDYAYVSGALLRTDEIVTSDIAVPVAEMKIRTADEKPMPEKNGNKK